MDLGLGRSLGLERVGGLGPVVVSRYIYDLVFRGAMVLEPGVPIRSLALV